MDEHSGALPQPTGDIQVLLFALLRGQQEDNQSLPWNTRRGTAGSGAWIQRPRHQVQRYYTVMTFTCWVHTNPWQHWNNCLCICGSIIFHTLFPNKNNVFMIPCRWSPSDNILWNWPGQSKTGCLCLCHKESLLVPNVHRRPAHLG